MGEVSHIDQDEIAAGVAAETEGLEEYQELRPEDRQHIEAFGANIMAQMAEGSVDMEAGLAKIQAEINALRKKRTASYH